MELRHATKRLAKIKHALQGPSGSDKTLFALLLVMVSLVTGTKQPS